MDSKVKVVMLGDGKVGKTSLTLQYIYGEFQPQLDRTVNATCLEKKIKL